MAHHWNYGDIVQGYFVIPDPNKRGHFVHEMRSAKIIGFAQPFWIIKRNWGYLGNALLEFECGRKSWQPIKPVLTAAVPFHD